MLRLFIFSIIVAFLSSCGSGDTNNKTAAQENWVLEQDIRYRYALNSVGLPDTTFVTTYYYKDGLVADSSLAFFVSKYSERFLMYTVHYNVGKDKKITPASYTNYSYGANKIMNGVSVYNSGKLTRQETYAYNDSNQIIAQKIIQMIVKGAPPAGTDTLPVNTSVELDPSILGYDTVNVAYKYDQTKKISGTVYTNNRGKVLRNDLNIYAGNIPLWSYGINAKGDTVQRVKYEPNGKMLHSRTENDSMILWQNTVDNIVVANKTFYKKINQLWRSAASYDQYGRKVAEKVYKNM